MSKLTPVLEFQWPSYGEIGPLFELTCKNHPTLRWSTKHPVHRSLHYLGVKDFEFTDEDRKYAFSECECPYSALQVMEDETEQ